MASSVPMIELEGGGREDNTAACIVLAYPMTPRVMRKELNSLPLTLSSLQKTQRISPPFPLSLS